jgi:hypothetical protein
MLGCFSRKAAMRPGVMVVSSASATTSVIFLSAGTAVETGPVLLVPDDEAPGVRSLHAVSAAAPIAPVAVRKVRLERGDGLGLMRSPGRGGTG